MAATRYDLLAWVHRPRLRRAARVIRLDQIRRDGETEGTLIRSDRAPVRDHLIERHRRCRVPATVDVRQTNVNTLAIVIRADPFFKRLRFRAPPSPTRKARGRPDPVRIPRPVGRDPDSSVPGAERAGGGSAENGCSVNQRLYRVYAPSKTLDGFLG